MVMDERPQSSGSRGAGQAASLIGAVLVLVAAVTPVPGQRVPNASAQPSVIVASGSVPVGGCSAVSMRPPFAEVRTAQAKPWRCSAPCATGAIAPAFSWGHRARRVSTSGRVAPSR